MSYPLKLELKHPFTYGSAEIKVINYRRPKAKDLKRININKIETGDIIGLFASISDQMPPAIDEMDAEDTMKAIEIVSDFLAPGQEIGN
jgi:hypothetical protein